jgi:hypothetical protein
MTAYNGAQVMQITRHIRVLPIFLLTMAALIMGTCIRQSWADEIPLEAAKIIIEFNSSAQDVGVQVFLDGEPWKSMDIFDPNGRKLYSLKGKGNVKKLGSTELFSESEEPSLVDLPLTEFLALFPVGEYRFSGKSAEGHDKLVGTATFTHNIPDGPVIVSPQAGAIVDPNNTVIDWDAVTTPTGIQIVQYQVTVEGGDPSREFSVFVLASTTSVKVPPEFLQANTAYNFEVLAIETGGNQTITEGSFSTQP